MRFHYKNIILFLLFGHFILAGKIEVFGPGIQSNSHQNEKQVDQNNDFSDAGDECPLFKRKIKPKGTEVTLPHLPGEVQNPFILFTDVKVKIISPSFAGPLYDLSLKRGPPVI